MVWNMPGMLVREAAHGITANAPCVRKYSSTPGHRLCFAPPILPAQTKPKTQRPQMLGRG